ncbi:hypothetical protein ACWDAZ_39900, partial [Streptomyces sp. NPDC001215]
PYAVRVRGGEGEAPASGGRTLQGAGRGEGAGFLANTLLPYGTFNMLSSGGTVPLLNAAIGMEVACAVVVLLARFLDQAVEIEDGHEHDKEDDTKR